MGEQMKTASLKLSSLLILGCTILTGCNSGTSGTNANNVGQSAKTSSACDGVSAWSATQVYASAGTLVIRNGNEYKNNWWTQGDDPATQSGASGSGKPWTLVTSCSVDPVVSPTPTPTPAPTITPQPSESSNLPTPIAFTPTSTASGTINYHLNLPYGSGNVEKLVLTANYTDLLISNYVAGALLGNMMHTKYPKLNFNRDYIYGSLFGQLLQENINTTNYLSTTDWINPVANERSSLLASGQGGPYQINDYSKRLENSNGYGLINFVAIQKGLGFTVEAQDNGTQTASSGPVSLDQKYFGPLAAAYFHFNDMNRLAQNNADTWGPQYQYYTKCMANLESANSASFTYNIYDLILNAAYNAGTYSTIIGDYFRICAGMYTTNPEKTQVKSIGDYSLSDTQYQTAIGTKEAAGSTFILYPRQIRIYLDQIYNQPKFTTGAISGTNKVSLTVQDIEYVFENTMGTLAYVNSSNAYNYIAYSDAKKAFEQALTQNSISLTGSLVISNASDKVKFFNLLDSAINNLATNLGIDFTKTTQVTIGGSSPSPTPTPDVTCPTNPQVYPAGRGSYVSGSIVKASDGNLYSCNKGVAAWCNSNADAYTPATGWAYSQAWTAYTCTK